MANLAGVVQQLRNERDRAQAELERLDDALGILGSLDGSFRGVRPKKRKVSAAARGRMVTAQRARRAKERGEKPILSKRPIPIRSKHKISAAGLASIRATQKARWAKWKKQRKAA
jgi:hypothetical protein